MSKADKGINCNMTEGLVVGLSDKTNDCFSDVRESAFFRSVVKSLPGLVFCSDVSGVVIFINDELENFGYKLFSNY